MGSQKKGTQIPPYVTFKAFTNLIEALREKGMPSHVTRDVLAGSNSAKATMMASLKSLKLLDENDQPSDKFKRLVNEENSYSHILREILEENYSFLLDDSFDLSSTTSDKVAEKFRERGAHGSTVTKGIAFFLSAAKDAEIEVSSYVKPPKIQSKPRKQKQKVEPVERGTDPSAPAHTFSESQADKGRDDKDRIVVSAYGMDDWEIFVPKNLSDSQWRHGLKIAVFMLENYRAQQIENAQEEVNHE